MCLQWTPTCIVPPQRKVGIGLLKILSFLYLPARAPLPTLSLSAATLGPPHRCSFLAHSFVSDVLWLPLSHSGLKLKHLSFLLSFITIKPVTRACPFFLSKVSRHSDLSFSSPCKPRSSTSLLPPTYSSAADATALCQHSPNPLLMLCSFPECSPSLPVSSGHALS